MPIVLPPSGGNPAEFEPLQDHQSLVAGNDAKIADGTALRWESSEWVDLAGALLQLVVAKNQYDLYGNFPITLTGTVPSSPDAPSTIYFEVAAASTTAWPPDQYQYMLTAILASGDRVTIAAGNLTVRAEPGTIPLYPPA